MNAQRVRPLVKRMRRLLRVLNHFPPCDRVACPIRVEVEDTRQRRRRFLRAGCQRAHYRGLQSLEVCAIRAAISGIRPPLTGDLERLTATAEMWR